MTELFVARAQQCAAKFRLGHDVEAGLIMIDLAGELQPCFDRASLEARQQWLHVLGLMLQCQEVQNWLALADYLEYELVQLISDSLSF